MKKLILSVFFCLAGCIALIAQTGSIRASQVLTGEVRNGQFVGWSGDWQTLPSSEQLVLEISEEIIDDGSEKYYLYYITFTFSDEILEGVYLYDSERSQQVRKEWNKNLVNCYVDIEDGTSYIYVEETSLQELARNPNAWAKYSNSAIQFLGDKINVAIR